MRRRATDRLYHLAEAANLASIERRGLLSTRKLLAEAGLSDEERCRLQSQQRFARTVLPSGVVIRDQVPMPPGALLRCLVDGMKPSDWYELVNTMVFFWFDRERLLRQARACRPWPQVIIEIESGRFLARYGSQAFVTPINVGNARRRPALRGRASFVPFGDWSSNGWKYEAERLGTKMRAASHQPAELVISNAVADVMDYVVAVHGPI